MRLFCYEKGWREGYFQCSSCSCAVSKVFLLADSQEEADIWYKKENLGYCADCLTDHLKNMEIRKGGKGHRR